MGPGGSPQRSTRVSERIGTAWTELRRASNMTVMREYLMDSGESALDLGQLDSLDLLATRPGWRMSDLAEALRVDPSTATRAVQRLVTSGLAERGSHGIDGRVVTVCITDAGRARHEVVEARRDQLMRHMLAAFRPAERPVLAEMFERFVAALDDFIDALPEE
jgi:DNA-binding MarR family transcriptional regulator